MPNRLATWVSLVGILAAGCRAPESADRVLINGQILTLDEARPRAQAVAIRGDHIVAVGTSDELRQRFSAAIEIDLDGRTVMPGIIDAHGHLLSLGESLMRLNVEGISEVSEVVKRVAERAAETSPGEWIVGWGWDEGAWAGSYPDNRALSRASPDNPVFLHGLHSFAGWANARALELAGISAATPDPTNGKILRDPSTGQPTGILTDRAQELVTDHVPATSREQMERALKLAAAECVEHGLTTVHDLNVSREMLEALEALAKRDELPLRVLAFLDGEDEELIAPFLDAGPRIDPRHRLSVRGIKLFTDGALGSRGAALFEPYSDAPQSRGLVTTSEEKLFELTRRALGSGMQIAAHAIGDRGNRITLDAFERALSAVEDATDPRLRIEHAQVLAPQEIPRFASLNVIASMQPPHATSDMPWAENRVGPQRIRGAYAWRSVLDSGARLCLSSDFPGETLNPFYGMYAAETRRDPKGEPADGFYPEQRLTRQEILRAYTTEAAYAGFEETIKGRIAPGMLADLIVLSQDIESVEPEELLTIEVSAAYLSGELVAGDEAAFR